LTEIRQELARAATMLDLGRYDEASALLARVVSADPGSSRAWCLFARAHLGADRYLAAVEAANRAAAIDPGEEWPHRLASNALMHLGNHVEALRAAAESRRLAPSYWQTHVCVAQAALAAGQLTVAASAAAEARKLAPNEPDVHFLSGKVALNQGLLDNARSHQEQALALDPSHSGAMNELGRIRLRRHDTAGAIRHFISAARTTPGEHIYSRNIDVVILRTVSRMIYFFVLIALFLLWLPAFTHVGRLPLAVGFGLLTLGTAVTFVIAALRLPREARGLVRRTLRTRRVAGALAVALAGVAIAFASVAFVPSSELPQILPVAFVVALAGRVAASTRLRSSASGNQPGAPGRANRAKRPRPPAKRLPADWNRLAGSGSLGRVRWVRSGRSRPADQVGPIKWGRLSGRAGGGAGDLVVVPACEGAVPVQRDRHAAAPG
jgi:tetratricopeptide (TPR) repeat protein